jgi:O-succinylbenzoic acid--CoA ligase
VKTNLFTINEKFKLNGVHYTEDDLLQVAYNFIKEGELYEQEIGNFLLYWLDYKDTLEVKTSGSTGIPKVIKIEKQAMVNSALATGAFFNLKPGDKALHCLPTQFIAGKMMLVRAIILGLEIDLVEPTSHPKFHPNKNYHFCAMIPMQLQNTYQNCHTIKTIIIGGASVSTTLKNTIQGMNSNVYETYGMTETVTHIALKKLNNLAPLLGGMAQQSIQSHFKLLPNIAISKDKRDCLVINAPKLSEDEIITNDMVKIYSETEFEWLGRFDNVINSGGIKLYPEQIEAKLQNKIPQRFFIASKPDETLGDQLILVLESDTNNLAASTYSDLEKYEKPKEIYTVKQFIQTSSGKIQRKKTLELIKL